MNTNDSGRRKLLKSLTVGSAVAVTAKSMPKEWTKPVVNEVLLPAHAQTTMPPFIPNFHGGNPMNRVNGVTGLSAPEQIFKGIIDSIIPTAQACVCRNVDVVIQHCCVKPAGSNNQIVNLQVAFLIQRDVPNEGVNIEHWGAQGVPVDGSTVSLSRLSPGNCLGIAASISIDAIGKTSKGTISMNTAVSSWSAPYDIPRGNQPLPAEQCGVAA